MPSADDQSTRRQTIYRIIFSKETVKELKGELQNAYERGDGRAVRRLSVLVMIGERLSLAVRIARASA